MKLTESEHNALEASLIASTRIVANPYELNKELERLEKELEDLKLDILKWRGKVYEMEQTIEALTK